jgi:uncharacterized protein
VYAVGDAHDLRERAVALVRSVAAGDLRATTTPEAIQEFAHVRSRRRDREDAADLALSYADLLSPLVEVGEDDLRNGLDLYRGSELLGAFDAVLAAVAIRRGAALVSADAAFANVAQLRFLDLSVADPNTLE